MTAPLHMLIRGQSPLIINIPHAGTTLPPGFEGSLSDPARSLPDTDWNLPFLFHFAVFAGATLMAATHSRYVIDVNRSPDDRSSLSDANLPGLVPGNTFDGDAVYRAGREPDARTIAERRARYWEPYHDELTERIGAIHERHGYAILLDAHAVKAWVPRLHDGRLPDFNIGTCDGLSCCPSLRRAAVETLQAEAQYSLSVDTVIKGGYTVRHYGRPELGLHALQLELVQDHYLDPGAPQEWQPARAENLSTSLRRLVDTLIAWRP